MLGLLEHRDVALRAVSAACKLVTRRPQRPEWNEFRMHVVSAVGEAFNNIVLHGYERQGGTIEVDARVVDDHIEIVLSDTAPPFDPTAVPEPDLSVPALWRRPGGMGIHLIRLSTDSIVHRPRPGGGNILTLTRSLDPRPKEER